MKNNHYKKEIVQIIYIAFSMILFYACTHTPVAKNLTIKKTLANKSYLLKPSSSFHDTLIIKSAAAVFYTPDSLQLEKIKSVNKKEIFKSLTHDCFYQMRNARIILRKYWPKIRITGTSKARYLLFIKSDKSKICIDLNKKNDICGLLIFDRKKDPELVDMMNVDTELGFYFKK